MVLYRYEGSLDPWMSSLWTTLNQINPNLLPNGVDFVLPDMKLMDQPKVVVTYHVNNAKSPIFSATSGNLFCLLKLRCSSLFCYLIFILVEVLE